jgi:protein SCO1/2
MRLSKNSMFVSATGFAALLAAGIMLFASLPIGSVGAWAQTDGEIMHFSLTADDGRRVSEQDFRGRYLMIQFGYTWCPDVCPMELALLTEVMDGLGAEAEKVQPLFISFDPARDSADVLATYVDNFHPAIIGLTGSHAEIARLVDAFGVIRIKQQEAGDGYDYAHSAKTYLLGPRGDYRGSIESLAPPDEVAAGLVEFLRDDAAAAE